MSSGWSHGVNTKQIGNKTEARILSTLVAAGYGVSIPFGDNEKYDLILDDGSRLYRVQCKTGWREDACIRFKTGSKTTVDGDPTVVDYDTTVDAFAVRCRDSGELYWVPSDDVGKKSTYLRLTEPAIDHPRVRLATDYLLEDRLTHLEDTR